MSEARRARQLRDLYAQVPNVQCKGLCHATCGPIAAAPAEWHTLAERGVHLPRRIRDLTMRCPALTALNTCRVYGDRPLICRLYGVTEGLPCEFGCVPDAVLTDDQAYDLIRRSWEIR